MTSNNDSFAIPAALKPRLMRCYGWDEGFTDRALKGYRNFMQLKRQLNDFDAAKLSPSLSVDLVWHQHILDVKHYTKACQDYCGELIGHDPDGALDEEARAKRIQATKLGIDVLVGSNHVDTEVWSFGNEEEGSSGNKRRRVSEGAAADALADSPGAFLVSVSMLAPTGETHFFKIKPTTIMQKLLHALAQRKGVQASALRLSFRGKDVEPMQTAACLGLNHNSRLCAAISPYWDMLGGEAITLRLRDQTGEETFFKTKDSVCMKKIFDAYSQLMGVKAEDLRFTVDGEYLDPNGTPQMLELEDQDKIDVMLVQAGC